MFGVLFQNKKENSRTSTILFSPSNERRLLLACLVSLIEHINSSGGIDDFHLAGVERMRGVRNLKLYEGVFNTVNGDGLLA